MTDGNRTGSPRSGAENTRSGGNRLGWRRVILALFIVAAGLDLIAVYSYYSDKRFFRSVAADIINKESLSDQEKLARFVGFAYNDLERPSYDDLKSPLIKLYYKYNLFHPSARNVVSYGCDYRGGCGSSSRVVLALLDVSGINSRSLVLRDENDRRIHAVVNASIDNTWAVADPLYGLVFTSVAGEIVTAEELRGNRALFLANVERNPSYPQAVFTYDNYALMNWKKIPVVLPAIRWVLSHTIGEERTAAISRPKIWMYPLPASAILFTVFALIFAGTIRLRPKRSP